jgi:hypothetical protein
MYGGCVTRWQVFFGFCWVASLFSFVLAVKINWPLILHFAFCILHVLANVATDYERRYGLETKPSHLLIMNLRVQVVAWEEQVLAKCHRHIGTPRPREVLAPDIRCK